MGIFESIKNKYEQNKEEKEIQVNQWKNHIRNCADKNRIAQISHLKDYLDFPSVKRADTIVLIKLFCEQKTYTNDSGKFTELFFRTEFYNKRGLVSSLDATDLPVDTNELLRVLLKICPCVMVNHNGRKRYWLESYKWNYGSRYDQDVYASIDGNMPSSLTKEYFDAAISSEDDIFIKQQEITHLSDGALLYLYNIIQCWKENNLSEKVGDYETWCEKKKFVLSYEDVVNSEMQRRNPAEYTKEESNEDKSKQPNDATENFGEKGELNVDYALKWLPKEYSSVRKNNNQKIFLKDTKISNEKQEIDHIVVGPNGVFSIETKYLKGNIKIDPNGNWSRVVEDDKIEGIKNPIQQVDRHHLIVSSILSDIVKDEDIHDIICLAYDTCTIEGIENSEIPVVKSDMITRHIKKTTSSKTYSQEDIEKILARIEAFRE